MSEPIKALAASAAAIAASPRVTPHTHDDHAVRVGYYLAWRCTRCHRVEQTDTRLGAA